jgi:hypothetical protein
MGKFEFSKIVRALAPFASLLFTTRWNEQLLPLTLALSPKGGYVFSDCVDFGAKSNQALQRSER